MGKIIIEGDNSLENMEIRLDHLLFGEKEMEQEKNDFLSFEGLLDERYRDFPAYLISVGQLAKASALIKGQDEVEIFFLMILAGDEKTLVLRTLEKNREALGEVFYQEMLCLAFLSADAEERKGILASILQVPQILRTPLATLIVARFSDEPQSIAPGGSPEQEAAVFLEALKAEQADNIEKAFSDLLALFIRSNHPRFLFEYLRSMVLRHDTIAPGTVRQFVETVLRSPLAVSFASMKLLEFLYYWRNNLLEKSEETVTQLAEATDSLFVLNAIAPLLYKYDKWHLLGKFYKLVSRKTTGKTRIRYLELLADIYEHKLKMPEFATEIHKNIVEEDPASCSISLSLVLSIYEENRQWDDLVNLYRYLAEREKEPRLAAYYLFRGGEILFRELNRPLDARPHLEHSLALNRSFEIIRLLSELYLRLQDYDAYIANLERELDYVGSDAERIALHERIADALITFKRAYTAAETHLNAILAFRPDRIDTVKKLGKIYYTTRNWEKLVEVNEREVSLSENTTDIVNLLYKNATIYCNELHDDEKAERSFFQILAIVEHHIPSLLYLEKIYLRRNAPSEIVSIYHRLLQSATTDSDTKEFYLTRLAIIYREQGDIRQALDTFRLVEHLYPDSTVARENLRLLSEEVEFREFTLDEFDNGELATLLAIVNDHGKRGKTPPRWESSTPDLYRYLWEQVTSGTAEFADDQMAPPERFLRQILEGRPTIDLLTKYADRPALLTLLAQRYLEKGYRQGIYTILAYYLKLNPELKRTFWGIFFMGRDHPELKTKLEAVLVTEKDTASFEIALNLIEKIYLIEKQYKTILFLRTLFIKKLKDPAHQCRIIDETITLLSGLIEPAELLDLYRLRYRLSEGTDRDGFLISYRDLLLSLNMRDTLAQLYEEKWQKDHALTDGGYLFDLYAVKRDAERAVALAHEIFDRYPDAVHLLDRLIDLYEILHRPHDANEALNRYFSDPSRPALGRTAALRLIQSHLRTNNIAEAVSLFPAISFPNEQERVAAGMDLAEKLLQKGQYAFAAQMLRPLSPTSEADALRKVSLLFSCGEPPTTDDLARIPRYEQVQRLAESYRNNPAGALFILRHYARQKDPTAVETLLHLLIDEQRTDEAETLAAEIRGSAAASAGVVPSLILRIERRTTEEKDLLRRILIPEISSGNPYPALRLMELAGADNHRARFFFQNLLAALGVTGYRPAEQEWQRLSALREELILAQANFRPLDAKIRSLAQLLAQARVAERKEERRFEPLSSSSHRDILALLEKLSLALRIDPASAFFDPSLIGPLTIGLANLPVLVFGKHATAVDRKRLAFLIAANLFLIGSGVSDGHQEKGVAALTARLGEILAMPDKARTAFVRTLKKKQQPDITAAITELEGTTEQDIAAFGERLYLAALLYAFSVIPDIGVVFALNGESKGNLDAPSSRSAQMFDFALNAFLG